MVHAILVLLGIYILYVLFIKGTLFRLLLAGFGWFGMFIFLSLYVDGLRENGVTIENFQISWAAIIPTFVVLMAMATTKD